MYSLVNVCTNDYAPIWNVVGIIIKVIWIGVPIALIVLGSIDLGKAVISSKEDEVKKAKKAVLVCCVVWIVTLVMGAISKIGINDTDTT